MHLEGWIISSGPLRLPRPSSRAPQSLPESDSQDLGLRAGNSFPQAAPARLSRGCFTCLFPPPLPAQYLGDFTIYSDSWLFIADWQVLVLGMKGRARKVETWSSWPFRATSILFPLPLGPSWFSRRSWLGGSELCNRVECKGNWCVKTLAWGRNTLLASSLVTLFPELVDW